MYKYFAAVIYKEYIVTRLNKVISKGFILGATQDKSRKPFH